jgi:hypothetical protein
VAELSGIKEEIGIFFSVTKLRNTADIGLSWWREKEFPPIINRRNM